MNRILFLTFFSTAITAFLCAQTFWAPMPAPTGNTTTYYYYIPERQTYYWVLPPSVHQPSTPSYQPSVPSYQPSVPSYQPTIPSSSLRLSAPPSSRPVVPPAASSAPPSAPSSQPSVRYVYPAYPGTPVARHYLSVKELYSDNKVTMPPKDWFSHVVYTKYADGTLVLTFVFYSGGTVEYRITNPVLRTRHGQSIIKTLYSNVETIGMYPVFSPVKCEVFSTDNNLHEVILYENNNTSVIINFRLYNQ
jgi:hypothetical protein